MDQQHDGDPDQRGPDYAGWEGLQEAPRSLFASAIDLLRGRDVSEWAVVIAQITLFLLAREVASSGQSDFSSYQRLGCILVLAFLIWAPALYYLYVPKAGRKRNASVSDRSQEPGSSSRAVA